MVINPFLPLPWLRAQKSVETGEADAMIAIASPARLEYAVASDDAVFSLYFTIYYSVDHPRAQEIKTIKTFEDVRALGLTTVSNRGNGWHIENVEKIGISTIYVNDDTSMLRFLAARRADIIIDTPLSMHSKLVTMGMETQLVSTGVHIGETRLVLLLGRKSYGYRRIEPEEFSVTIAVNLWYSKGTYEISATSYNSNFSYCPRHYSRSAPGRHPSDLFWRLRKSFAHRTDGERRRSGSDRLGLFTKRFSAPGRGMEISVRPPGGTGKGCGTLFSRSARFYHK